MKRAEKRNDIFISYRREGGGMAALHIAEELKKRRYNVFFDRESLRASWFNEELRGQIRACRDFVLILSPGALDRCVNEGDWVRIEIEEALGSGKNIIPLMMDGFSFPETLPESIAQLRYRHALTMSMDYFREGIDRLCGDFLSVRPRPRLGAIAAAAAALICALAIGGAAFMGVLPGQDGKVVPAGPAAEATPEPATMPEPTAEPTPELTATPEPTEEATIEPTATPEPTAEPTATPEPTEEPTPEPTATPEPTPVAPGMGEPIAAASLTGGTKILSAGNYAHADMQALMDDESVEAVVVMEGATVDLDPRDGLMEITKPVWVQEGATLRTSNVIVSGGGALSVAGKLDALGLIELQGEGTKLYIAGTLSQDSARNTVIIMDDGANLSIADSALIEEMGSRLLLCPQYKDDTVSVSTLEELIDALEGEHDVAIVADIVSDEWLDLENKTLWISEGVTLRFTENHINLSLWDGAVLVNDGTIMGDVNLNGKSVLLNWGSGALTGEGTGTYDVGGLSAHADSVIVNYGLCDIGRGANLCGGSLTVNLGLINAYDFYLPGGNLVNAGQITMPDWLPNGQRVTDAEPGNDTKLVLYNAATLYNRGYVTMESIGRLVSHSRVINEGLIQGVGHRDYHTLQGFIDNRGEVRLTKNTQTSAIVFGPGVYEMPDYAFCFIEQIASTDVPQDAVAVSDTDQLRQAMQGDHPVVVTGSLSVSLPVEVTRPLYICGTLSAGEEAAITSSGFPVILCEGGSLDVAQLELRGNAELHVCPGSSLTVRPGGMLLLENAILDGMDANMSIEGAKFQLDESVFAPGRMASFNADDAEIVVGDGSWFMPPYQNAFAANGLRMTFYRCHATFASNMELSGAQIALIDGSDVRVTSARALLHDCDITVEGRDSCLLFEFCQVSLTGKTQLLNEKNTVGFSGFGEGNWLSATGDVRIVNRGRMELGLESRLQTIVDNQGEFYYSPWVFEDEGFTQITGNPARAMQ